VLFSYQDIGSCGLTPFNAFTPQTFGPTKIHIPKAPALGLLLEQPRFGVYNLKVGESNSAVRAASENSLGSIKPSAARPSNPSASTTNDLVEAGERPEAERETKPKFSGEESLPGGPTTKEKIDFEKHRDLIDEFKKKYIYSIMWREERAHRVYVPSSSNMKTTSDGPLHDTYNSSPASPDG
jgi:tRNA pseudouridine38-40 synthase